MILIICWFNGQFSQTDSKTAKPSKNQIPITIDTKTTPETETMNNTAKTNARTRTTGTSDRNAIFSHLTYISISKKWSNMIITNNLITGPWIWNWIVRIMHVEMDWETELKVRNCSTLRGLNCRKLMKILIDIFNHIWLMQGRKEFRLETNTKTSKFQAKSKFRQKEVKENLHTSNRNRRKKIVLSHQQIQIHVTKMTTNLIANEPLE